ncbi:MAG: ribonuclease Z [Myxococcota bacterium]
MLELVVVGSGTAVPDADRGPAGFLVCVGARTWLVDGGSGTLGRCARLGVDPVQLDGGFYTHHHPDHCGDLVPLLFAMRVAGHVGGTARRRDYPIVAGAGFRAFFDQLGAAYGKWVSPGSAAVVVHELPLDRTAVWHHGPLTVHTAPANHAAAALHLAFTAGGRTVVLSGDTGPSDALVELARGADLLVCECGSNRPSTDHLWPEAVREIAAAARPGAVWLTHLYPDLDPTAAVDAVARSGVPTRRASDLDRWR